MTPPCFIILRFPILLIAEVFVFYSNPIFCHFFFLLNAALLAATPDGIFFLVFLFVRISPLHNVPEKGALSVQLINEGMNVESRQ